MSPTAEQKARDLLERLGWEKAQSLTAADVIELANLLLEVVKLQHQVARADCVHTMIVGELETARREVERLRAKLQTVRDWIKFAANSPGGLVADIDEVLAVAAAKE